MIRIFILSLLVFFSCKSEKIPPSSTEVLEVYNTIEDGQGFRRGELMHYESKNFKNEKHIETLYYDGNGEAKGREVLIYSGGEKLPSKSEYRDPSNNLLSYYRIEYNADGKKIKSYAYDGVNNELLRIEVFEYHDGNRVKKEIRNNSEEVQQSFIFGFDEYDNETKMVVVNGSGDTLAIETYQITLKDDNNNWLEKWGFVNDKPSTYQVLKK